MPNQGDYRDPYELKRFGLNSTVDGKTTGHSHHHARRNVRALIPSSLVDNFMPCPDMLSLYPGKLSLLLRRELLNLIFRECIHGLTCLSERLTNVARGGFGFVQKQMSDRTRNSNKMTLTLTLSRPTEEGTARLVSRSFQSGWIRQPTEDDSPSPIRYLFTVGHARAAGARRLRRFRVAQTRDVTEKPRLRKSRAVKRPEGRAPTQIVVGALSATGHIQGLPRRLVRAGQVCIRVDPPACGCQFMVLRQAPAIG